jgi:hypothetical protein
VEHHQYERTSDDDNTCTECGVIVDETVLEALMLLCPVAPCTEPSNEGEPCVFVPSETVPVCAYCGRNGDPHGEYDGSGDIWDDLPDVDFEDDEDEDQPFG